MLDKKGTLFRVFVRSFCIQGTWNFERMQNLGFCYAILPALKNIYRREEDLKEAVKRHLEFFNTHPYMASPIIGAAVCMEEEISNGVLKGDDVKTMKTGVMGSYGAIGDSFFWGALKPFSALAAVSAAFFGTAVAPFLFLLIYNVLHLSMRFFGLYRGYREGIHVFDKLKDLNFTGATKRLRTLTILAAGLFLAVFLNFKAPLAGGGWAEGMIFFFVVSFMYAAIRKGMSMQALIYLSLILSIGASAIK